MSERRNSSPYRYHQHSHAIHNKSIHLPTPPAFLPYPPTTLPTPPFSPWLPPPTPSTSAFVSPHLGRHPFWQLPSHPHLHCVALHTPLPAVTLSPHSLSSPPRDLAIAVFKKPFAKTASAHRDSTDASQQNSCSVPTSASIMTSDALPKPVLTQKVVCQPEDMPPTNSRIHRPSAVSQHSNSVPSTPLQIARRFAHQSRSPSPNGDLGGHSPRSVSSEANSTMPTLRLSRPFKCKFETNVGMLGRRRIPYQSEEILGPARGEIKKTLDPHEAGKLSGDMRELYDRLQPSQRDIDVRDKFVAKVQMILETEFPGNHFKVLVFGSSGNMLWTTDSDVDICIQTPLKRLEEMHPLAEAFDKHGMQRVVCIPAAKVRIVKIWDPQLQLACDINVNNVAAIENTRMIKTYIQIDDRVRPLAMIIKHWTKKRILNDAGIGGTISSYTWICLILNFLQTRDPPVVPILHNLPSHTLDQITDKTSAAAFVDDANKISGFKSSNEEDLGQLLFQFFRLYGHDVDYEKEAISVRQGKRIRREERGWHPGGGHKEGVNRLCVEEPFNIERNLGNSADGYAWHGIHLELRRAFDLLSDNQQLDKLCEQFDYPPEEKSSAIFKKPQSQKAILTSSAPNRNGRGNSNHRGGRGGFNPKGQYGNSRRSSGGSTFTQGRPTFLHSPPISGSAPPDYHAFPRGLHDQLFQQYQMLELQSNTLRVQLAAHQQAQQAHHVRAAQIHAHAVAQAQSSSRAPNSTTGSPQKSSFVNGRQSPRLAEMELSPGVLPQGFLYHYPGYFNTSPHDSSQEGPRTNPSSPSLSNSMPGVRRSPHRTSNESETSSLRSHSQPPRGMQQPMIVGYPPMSTYLDPMMFAGFPIPMPTQDNPNQLPVLDPRHDLASNDPDVVVASEASTPNKPVEESMVDLPLARSLQGYMVSQIPTFSELAQRRYRRVSSEVTHSIPNTTLRHASRSPSPAHARSFSTGVTKPTISSNDFRTTRIDSTRPPNDSGPMIVNGSYPVPPRIRSDTLDAVPPARLSGLGIYTKDQTVHQINELEMHRQLVLDEMQRQRMMEAMSPAIANGSTQSNSPTDSHSPMRVSSDGQQQFSPLAEAWTGYDVNNHQDMHAREEASPSMALPQWRNVPYSMGPAPLDTAKLPRANSQDIKSATAVPLLSPVFETRTPSPSASRSLDVNKPINGNRVLTKENDVQQRRASQTPLAAASKDIRQVPQKLNMQKRENGTKSSSGSTTPVAYQNGWQSATRKKNKKKPKTMEQKAGGEPLPADPVDCKGG